MTAEDVVETYLAAVEDGRADEAARHLADGAELVFPGGRRYTSLAEQIDGSAGRYRWVGKHRDHTESFETGDGEVVVYSIGRLHGINRHGAAFDGVRYIDRFCLRDGRIVRQWVWNDLAGSGALERRP